MIQSNEEFYAVLKELALEATTTERLFKVLEMFEKSGINGAIVITKH